MPGGGSAISRSVSFRIRRGRAIAGRGAGSCLCGRTGVVVESWERGGRGGEGRRVEKRKKGRDVNQSDVQGVRLTNTTLTSNQGPNFQT